MKFYRVIKRKKREIMAILLMIFAGFFSAASNLCLRRNLDACGSSKSFFIFQMTLTCLVAIWLYPCKEGSLVCSSMTALLGVGAGVSLAVMKWMIARALGLGPSGLTYAAINSAAIFPAFIMFYLFSGYADIEFNRWHLIGSVLVLIGIFWAARHPEGFAHKKKWLGAAITGFFFYIIFMTVSQLFVALNQKLGIEPAHAAWFLPITFFTALLIHMFFFTREEKRLPHKFEMKWGTVGGILNGLGAILFMGAIEIATPLESSYIFPLFTVALITTCNLWGRYLYKELINWKATAVCFAGIFLAMS